MESLRKIGAFYFCGLVILGMLFAGCGFKGPPVAPGPVPLPAVEDLHLTKGPGSIWLSWSWPPTSAMDPADGTAFAIYRSKTDSLKAECKDCPVIFDRLAQMPIEARAPFEAGRAPFAYEDFLQRGFNYIYKVKIVHRDGREGPDSNTVTVSF